MVTCELDEEVSGEIMGWKVPAWQALLLHRVLPSCGGLIVYLILMCFDFAIVAEHFKNGEDGIAAFCLVLMVLPALLSLVFTLASPPPGLQTELSAFTVNIEKNEKRWILMQFVNFLFFPVAAIGRYCHQIFWWVEAVCASRDEDELRTREALLRARAPSPLELYLFLQAFIHSAPHTIVNILNMMASYSDPAFDKISVQAVSIVASSLRMASTATVYRRFEREKLCGRKYPWNTQALIDNTTNENIEKFNKLNEEEHIYEPIMMSQSPALQEESDSKNKINRDLIQFSPKYSDNFFDDLASDSGTSSDYLPASPYDKNSHKLAVDSDEEYVKPISIIDRVAPRRRDTQYTIEEVYIAPPPDMPAPRPGSLSMWAEKLVENAESIPSWLSAPPRRKHLDDIAEEVIEDEPDIPRRVPRAFMRGLEPQDVSAALVNYLGWYTFFVARLISIAAFIDCMPVSAIIILFSHYQVMLLFLIVPQASTVRRGFYVFLAFIYLFCLMEFKIRFRHVRVWHVFWIIVCTIEIVTFTSLWATINNNLGDWWRMYIVNVIIGSMLLSYMCFLVYFVLLKPRETIVYINSKINVSTV